MGVVQIAVVGAGISGLSAAYRLRQRLGSQARILVFDVGPRPGGKLRSGDLTGLAGFPVDEGAEAFRLTPGMTTLLSELGVAHRVAAPTGRRPLVYLDGRLHPLPAGTLMGIPGSPSALEGSGLLAPESIARVAQDERAQGVPLLAPGQDVTVGALVRGRLGGELLDRLVGPVLAGVYAGDPDALSLRMTLPTLASALETESSLVRAVARILDASRAAAGPTAAASDSAFVTLTGGMEQLAVAMTRAADADVHQGAPVRGIERSDSGWVVQAGSAGRAFGDAVPPEGRRGGAVTAEVDGLVLALPGVPAARLLDPHLPEQARALSHLSYASVGVVTLAYREARLPDASGVLIPEQGCVTAKAMTFTTNKWPLGAEHGRPADVSVLRVSVGRADDHAVLQGTDASLAGLAATDVRTVTGLDTDPFTWRVSRWGGALPQYEPGHMARTATLRSQVAQLGAVAVCGAAYDGVGIAACVASGLGAADAVLARLG